VTSAAEPVAQQQFDAVIIGAGIIGAAIAFELAGRGWRTLNVDRLPAAGYGSTSNSCAIVRTYYSTFEGCAMAFEGYRAWKDWAGYLGVDDERGLAAFVECGTLIMKSEHNGFMRPILEIARQLGIRFEEWDNASIRSRLPEWDLRQFAPVKRPDHPGFGEPTGEAMPGAVFFPEGGYVNDPQLATHNLQRAAEASGARFRFNARVSEIRQQDGRISGITLAGGEQIDAPVVVNAAGPHSAKINALAGIGGGMRIRTRALRTEVVYLKAPTSLYAEGRGMVTSDSDIGCYTRPAGEDQILIGSEDPACDEPEWVDPDHYDRAMSTQGQVQVMRTAQRAPVLGIPNLVQGVVDLYDVTDDWIPIYDKSDLPGFYLAIGTSGNQFKNAPVAGELVASLIGACEAGHDHDADPLPLTLRRTGREISIGFYSRNREVNRDSSFTVLG
jgi:sarcosine oxidase subunit beta